MRSLVALSFGIVLVVAPSLANAQPSGAEPQKPASKRASSLADERLITVPSDVAAPPKQARKTASGLAYVRLSKGSGKRRPRPSDRVRVHYSGWTTNGRMFDSSVARGEPAEFPVDGVIKGWTEGLQLMVVGDKMRFWIPAELAYGHTPRRPGLPAGMLVFEVELLDIKANK